MNLSFSIGRLLNRYCSRFGCVIPRTNNQRYINQGCKELSETSETRLPREAMLRFSSVGEINTLRVLTVNGVCGSLKTAKQRGTLITALKYHTVLFN
jgi:hypothetical protein